MKRNNTLSEIKGEKGVPALTTTHVTRLHKQQGEM